MRVIKGRTKWGVSSNVEFTWSRRDHFTGEVERVSKPVDC
jgi:hypothetical protein